MDTEGQIPAMLVLWDLPSLPAGKANNRDQAMRSGVVRTAREEMERILAELRVSNALRARLFPSTRFDFEIVKAVRVWTDRSSRYECPSTWALLVEAIRFCI